MKLYDYTLIILMFFALYTSHDVIERNVIKEIRANRVEASNKVLVDNINACMRYMKQVTDKSHMVENGIVKELK